MTKLQRHKVYIKAFNMLLKTPEHKNCLCYVLSLCYGIYNSRKALELSPELDLFFPYKSNLQPYDRWFGDNSDKVTQKQIDFAQEHRLMVLLFMIEMTK